MESGKTVQAAAKAKTSYTSLLSKYFSIIALVVILVVFSIWNSRFLTVTNFRIIAQQSAVLAVAAFGATLVIITASIDLSVGSVVGLCAVISAAVAQATSPALGMLAAVLVGLAAGSFNGIVFAKAKIPSFIVTLGVLNAGRGLILMITQGKPILVESAFQRFLGGGMIGGIPFLPLLAIIFAFITQYVLAYTPFGRYVFAIGGGENVAKLSGVNTDATKVWAFVIAGLYAGIAGVLLGGRMGAGSPTAGSGLELDVITAVILGGTLLSGGVGSALGTLVGALIMGAMSNGLNIAGVNPYVQFVVKGLVLVLAVGITLDRKKVGVVIK